MLKVETPHGTVTVKNSERTLCEIWSRVMGYYRPVSEFNIGKKREHRDRKYYREKKAMREL